MDDTGVQGPGETGGVYDLLLEKGRWYPEDQSQGRQHGACQKCIFLVLYP